jgi:peroxiredoxin Q/BCP
MAKLRVGDAAPDFQLEGTEGPFHLAEHRGERVVLLFYPADNSPVCTRQFCSYRDHREEVAQLGATVVGISPQSLDSHQGFREKHGLTVPLLSDPQGQVARKYGCWGRPVGAKRATFVIDEQGVVRHADVHRVGLTYENVDDLRAALAY